MTPREKAQELVNKFLLYSDDGDLKNKYWKIRNAKQCGLIAVNEILNSVMIWWEIPVKDPYFITQKNYWLDVKLEIEKYG